MADSGRGRGRGRSRGRGAGDYQARGGDNSPRGRGNEYSPRGRGSDLPLRERGGSFQPRGRGNAGQGGRGSRGGRGGMSSEAYRPASGIDPVVDPLVTDAENKLVLPRTDRELNLSKLSIKETLPHRPGFGTRGDKVVLWTNYFQLLPSPDVKLHRYAIDISPNAKARLHRARIVGLFLAETPIKAFGSKIASDFQANIISSVKLDQRYLKSTFKYRLEEEDIPADEAKNFTVSLEYVASFLVSDLIGHVTSTNPSDTVENHQPFIQVLNIVLGHFPKTYHPRDALSKIAMNKGSNLLVKVDASAGEGFDLTAGLQAWRGYFTSVRTATSRLLVNAQVKHVAMYRPGRLDELMRDFQVQNGRSLVKLNAFVSRVRVRRTHFDKKKRDAPSSGRRSSAPKTILGLAKPGDGGSNSRDIQVERFGANAKEVRFKLGSENVPKGLTPDSTVTVFEYFQKGFGISANLDYPVVDAGTKDKPIYLLAERCEVLPAQPASAKLSADQTAQMIKFAVRKPFQNARSITEQGLPQLGLKPINSVMGEFGLGLNPDMLAVNARILPTPKLQYGNSQTVPRFGSWNMNNVKFSQPASLKAWSVIWILSPRSSDPWAQDPSKLKSTLEDFHGVLRSTGMACPMPMLPGVQVKIDDLSKTKKDELEVANRRAITDAFEKIKGRDLGEQLLLVILPYEDTDLYNIVKRCGDAEYGIHTSCVLAKNFAKPNNIQYFANEALKLNLKLGGHNHTLDAENLGFIAKGKTMVVGIDVTHPSPGSSPDTPSIAAVVASTDKTLGQFPGVLKTQQAREEMVSDLTDMVKTRLSLWRKHNRMLPENIIVYRDGVSEGQHSLVLEKELPKLRLACREMYSPNERQPGLAVIIVGKRHHTRFYLTSDENSNQVDQRSSNTRHGTVVDRGVTEARVWDFYLQAHTAIKGTARPAHYLVIHDEIFRQVVLPRGFESASDVLEAITHALCYMFPRATKAVSYCPAAYCADLLCARGRVHLSHLFSPSNTPAASEAGSVSGRGENVSLGIHDALKDTMFYM